MESSFLNSETNNEIISQTFILFGKLLLDIPQKKTLNELKRDLLLNDWYIEPVRNAQIIKDLTNNVIIDLNHADSYSSIKYDYTQLFIFGDMTISAVPWGSVYLNKHNETFTDETTQVKNIYDKYDFKLPKTFKEPADHIGIQLTFIGSLISQFNELTEIEKQEALKDILNILSNYLLPWTPSFLSKVINNSKTNFYKLIAYLLDDFLYQLQNVMNIKVSDRKIYY